MILTLVDHRRDDDQPVGDDVGFGVDDPTAEFDPQREDDQPVGTVMTSE